MEILLFTEPAPYYSIASLFVIYLAINWSGAYTKYLTEKSQRKAFLETRRSLETRFKTQQENERQEINIFFNFQVNSRLLTKQCSFPLISL